MVTPENIKALAPEFEAKSDQYIQLFIDIASKEIAEPAWNNDSYDKALTLLVCHYLTMAGRSGSSGPLSSIKVGQVSVSFGSPKDSEKLGLTSWGQLFLQLRDAHIVAPMLV